MTVGTIVNGRFHIVRTSKCVGQNYQIFRQIVKNYPKGESRTAEKWKKDGCCSVACTELLDAAQ